MIHLHPYLPRSLVLGFLFWSAADIPPARSAAIILVFCSAMKGDDGARWNPDVGDDDAGGKTDDLFLPLEGISSVNCCCTLTVFLSILGIFGSRNSISSLADRECTAGKDVEEDMAYYLIFSLACFLFSTFFVQCLKLAVMFGGRRPEGLHLWSLGRWSEKHGWGPMRVRWALLVVGVGVSLVGLTFGSGFGLRAFVNVMQIKLGRLDCSAATVAAVKPMIILLPICVLLIVSTMLFIAVTG